MSCPNCNKKDFQFRPHELAIERGEYLSMSESTNEPYFFIAPVDASAIFKVTKHDRRCLNCNTEYKEFSMDNFF